MNELRSVQHSVELLRSRIDGVEALRDVSGLREGQDSLSNRIGRFQESVNLNHVSESLRWIIRLEESDGHGQVALSLRECHVRVNHCEASLHDLENRMRTQDWFHDLSEQESSDEIPRMLDGTPRPDSQHQNVVWVREQEFFGSPLTMVCPASTRRTSEWAGQ